MKILILLLLVGCAPMDEERIYAREDRLNQAREEYHQKARACRAAGGIMVIRKRMRDYDYHDYKMASCQSRNSLGF